MRRRLTLIFAASLIVAGAPVASAATVVGTSAVAADTACPGGSLISTVLPSHVAPAAGIVTSFSLNRPVAGGQVALKTLRASGSDRIVAGTSGVVAVPAAGLTTYPARIAVVAGDSIALWLEGAQTCSLTFPGQSIVVDSIFPVDPGVGTNVPTVVNTGNRQLVLSAVIEADANGDGFGDESQQCRVPNLKGYTVTKAKAMLATAQCGLGKTKKKKLKKFTKKSKKNRIRTQSPAFGTVRPAGFRVDITINTKKQKSHKSK